jgi:hypothetical protein
VHVSIDGRGRALDNVFTERLWRSIKYEEAYLKNYRTPREARLGIQRYFEFYNYLRPNQALSYQTPAVAYFGDQTGVQLSRVEMEGSTFFCVKNNGSTSINGCEMYD